MAIKAKTLQMLTYGERPGYFNSPTLYIFLRKIKFKKMVTTKFRHFFELNSFLNMRDLRSHSGVAEDSSLPECYAVSTGEVTDISKDHNFSIFTVKHSKKISYTLYSSPDDHDINHKGRSTEFSLYSRKHVKKKTVQKLH